VAEVEREWLLHDVCGQTYHVDYAHVCPGPPVKPVNPFERKLSDADVKAVATEIVRQLKGR
jgi:hypothetical protein